MNPDQWTAEIHVHPEYGGDNWFCVAPESNPKAGHPGRYPFSHFLPDGRRAYGFLTRGKAEQAAVRANTHSEQGAVR